MTANDPSAEYAYWTTADGQFTVTYSLGLFHEIDFVVNEGYRRIPHGGIEVGGLLFGRAEEKAARIEAFRTIECEHALGPSFVLSDRDIANIEDQLNQAKSDPELDGLQPVGWFVGHTRTPLQMAERELGWFNRFFPNAGAVAVLIKPERFQPTRYGFLVRSVDGQVQTDASKEAVILPLLGRGGRVANGPIASIPAPAPRPPVPPAQPRTVPDVQPASERLPEEPVPEAPQPFRPTPQPDVAPPVRTAEEPRVVEPVAFIPPPSPQQQPTPAVPPEIVTPRSVPEPTPPSAPAQLAVPASPITSAVPAPPVTSAVVASPVAPAAPPVPESEALPSLDEIRRRRGVAPPEPPREPTGIEPRGRTTRLRVEQPAHSGVRFALVLLIAAILGCGVGYFCYLQLPSPIITLTAREQAGTLVISWPAEQTSTAAYAAIRVDNGEPVTLSPQQKEIGQASVAANADQLKIELIAQHWMRDSRGILRFVRAATPTSTSTAPDLPSGPATVPSPAAATATR